MQEKVVKVADRLYEVEGQSQLQSYRVSLSDPSCTCCDYISHCYPCKHIYAALALEGKTFMDLPDAYIESPWFTLDYQVMSIRSEDMDMSSVNDDVPESEPIELTHVEPTTPQRLHDLPQKTKVQMSTATHCRELLHQLRSLTYKVCNEEVLQNLAKSLNIQISTLDRSINSVEGFHKEPGSKTSGRYRRKPTVKSTPCSVNQPQPLPKRAVPSKWSGRVGVSAQQHRPVQLSTMSRAKDILQRAMQLQRAKTLQAKSDKSALLTTAKDVEVCAFNVYRGL